MALYLAIRAAIVPALQHLLPCFYLGRGGDFGCGVFSSFGHGSLRVVRYLVEVVKVLVVWRRPSTQLRCY